MSEPILKIENLHKWFPLRRTITQILKGEHVWVKAVDGITFNINQGEIFGLVGESGCGKTTTGKLLMKLLEPTDGKIIFKGKDVTHLEANKLKEYRRNVQMVFQDPYASMNPRFRAQDVLEEPLIIHQVGETRAEREKIVRRSLEEVRLIPPEEFMGRFPHMLSGGQRQRVATARTLVLSPSMIVADEPVSMIDLSTRAEILHMMKTVQRELGLTYLYITHDLSTARYFTDRIAVMYLGKIIEMGGADEIIDEAAHPYTRALIAAVCEPISGKSNTIKEIPIKGEIPSAANIPSGCRFHPRCLYAKPQCQEEEPILIEIEPGHMVACHYPSV
ncbi:MAG: ABC transporter ATP-binding protein [bacterium]|nr:ABC transporter ATP-binding protein [bacterium]MBU1290232.1 ABC transporter ATP-binding protein [bacterium]MBU2439879.1 ABC transporter ATP-binding protein [bacterium]